MVLFLLMLQLVSLVLFSVVKSSSICWRVSQHVLLAGVGLGLGSDVGLGSFGVGVGAVGAVGAAAVALSVVAAGVVGVVVIGVDVADV